MTRQLVAAALLLLLASGAAASGTDPRLDRADAGLADRTRWPDSIDLYREILAEDPSRSEVRLHLARVLAWSGRYEDSLREYEHILQALPEDDVAGVERAEVLSWSGAYADAETAFRRLLDDRPDYSRATRGLARVYLWSGRKREAHATFRLALALEEDPEARAEWKQLDRELRPRLELGSRFFEDSSKMLIYEAFLTGSAALDFETRIFARAGIVKVRERLESEFPQRDRASDFAVGIERRLSPRWHGALTVGSRHWRHAKDRPYARGDLEFSPSATMALQLSLSREDHLNYSESRRALAEGVRGTYGRFGVWKALSPQMELYGQVLGGWLSDHNQLRSGFLDLTWRPWEDRSTRLSLSTQLQNYTFRRSSYYTPNISAGTSLTLGHRFGNDKLFFEGQLEGGWGYTRERPIRGAGPQWATQATLGWRIGSFQLRMQGRFDRTQRTEPYSARRLQLTLAREF